MTKPQASSRAEKGAGFSLPWPILTRYSFIGLLLSLLLWCYMITHDPGILPIKQVVIEGDFPQLDRAAVKQAILPNVMDGFFHVAVGRIQQQVQQVPWVERAHVHRVWPDKVIVNVTAKAPAYRWNQSGIISASGQVFFPQPETIPADLPELYGPSEQSQTMLKQLKILDSLLSELGLSIRRAKLSPRHAWQLGLSNGIMLKLGREQTQERVARFVQLYPRVIAEQEKTAEVVDLRYVNGMAVQWAKEGREKH